MVKTFFIAKCRFFVLMFTVSSQLVLRYQCPTVSKSSWAKLFANTLPAFVIHPLFATAFFSSVCRLLGYCPQTDPLLSLMTVQETLLFFGGLKGVASKSLGRNNRRENTNTDTARSRKEAALLSLKRAAAAAMAAVSLGPTENQLAGTLSGGNKRKLSLAVALIGEPPVLLLDEPSSGMDPGARRYEKRPGGFEG